MKKLLLITGDLAAGKSTFAGILSRRYGAVALQKDTIKETLGDAIGWADRQENLKLSQAAVAVMGLLFSQCAALGKDLILEANFHAPELERIHAIAAEQGYETLTLVLRGDAAVLHRRYLDRIRHQNRHPVHLSAVLDEPEDFLAYVEHGRGEAVLGEVFSIDAGGFTYQTDPLILERIDRFMEG